MALTANEVEVEDGWVSTDNPDAKPKEEAMDIDDIDN